MISGHAPELVVTWPNGFVDIEVLDAELAEVPVERNAAGAPSNYEWTVKKTEATLAIKQMGYSHAEARGFVEQAVERLPPTTSLAQLLREALRIARRGMGGAVRS